MLKPEPGQVLSVHLQSTSASVANSPAFKQQPTAASGWKHVRLETIRERDRGMVGGRDLQVGLVVALGWLGAGAVDTSGINSAGGGSSYGRNK